MSGIFGGKTVHNYADKIGAFQVNSATYGVTVPVIFGTSRISANIIDYYDFTAIPHTETQGGKGGGEVQNTTYTYKVSALLGLCEGPIHGIGKVWRDKEILSGSESERSKMFDWHDNTTVSIDDGDWASTKSVIIVTTIGEFPATLGVDYNDLSNGTYTMLTESNNEFVRNISLIIIYKAYNSSLGGTVQAGLTLFNGDYGQQPWSNTQSKHPEKALPYSGLAYLAGVLDLGNSAGLPNYGFEVKSLLTETGDGIDANPADVINYIVFDTVNGVGFGSGGVDALGLNRLRTFCQAADLLISSPGDSDTKKAYEIIKDICSATNTINFWSQNKLKLVPLCDERLEHNGVVFEPNTTPIYDLTADDFLPLDDGKLVEFERADNSETFNQATIEFINRANNYEVETDDYQVLADITRRGLRPADTEAIHWLHSKERAHYVGGLRVMKSLYGRNKYHFKLDWTYCRLEPGDLLTLTDEATGLNKVPVIIDEAEEAADGELEFLAIGKPPGIYSPARYNVHQASRPSVNVYVDPGNTTTPAIFEPPSDLTVNGLETWIAVDGGEYWGGCNVWISDDGNTYKRVGSVTSPSRYGTLTSDFSADSDTLQIKLFDTNSQLLSGTQQDAQNMRTICWVDGEMIAYTTATLTGPGQYTLSGLVRGAYNTQQSAHGSGCMFVRCDEALFRYPFDRSMIGKMIYIKLTSFNVYNSVEKSLSDVEAIQHQITEHYFPQVTNLQAFQRYREVGDGTITYEIDLSFTPPNSSIYDHSDVYVNCDHPNWEEVDVSWDEIDQTFDEIGNSIPNFHYVGKVNNRYTLPNVMVGATYTFKVVAVDKFGNGADEGNAPTKTCTVSFKPYTPVMPSGLVLDFRDKVYASWRPNNDTDIDFYELRLDANKGVKAGMLYSGSAITATPTLTKRSGTVYLFAHNPSGKYSPPLVYTYNKSAPIVPTNIQITPAFQSLIITCAAIPTYCLGINVHIDGGTGDKIYTSPNNSYNFKSTGGVYSVKVCYVDIFGEGELSEEFSATVKDVIDPALIAAESLSLEKMDQTIQDAVANAQNAVSGATFSDAINQLNQANQSLGNSITQTSEQTTSIITELGKPIGQCSYTAIVQANQAINLRVSTSDFTGAKIVSQINLSPSGTVIDGKLLHVTGQTLFDNAVIVNSMLAANVVTSDKISAGAITADKLSVDSITANSIQSNSITLGKIALSALNNNTVLVKGTISHGQVIPLPDGYTNEQCICFILGVVPNTWTWITPSLQGDYWPGPNLSINPITRQVTAVEYAWGGISQQNYYTYTGTVYYAILGVR